VYNYLLEFLSFFSSQNVLHSKVKRKSIFLIKKYKSKSIRVLNTIISNQGLLSIVSFAF
jgi:hypothetical protein